ncbi:MAG: hypothetical protein KGJ68_01800 [Gammaproteobacteria bacterium]|nr:hypothetical protein [Gammaproteobacteria bacterium]
MSSDDRRGPSRGLAAAVAGSEAALPWLFALYAAATLLHFAHNAQYLAQYPNLPASWSRAEVYAAWCALMGLGLLGLALYGLGARRGGRAILGLYAGLGFGGLLHYTRAPLMHHSSMMNVTIWAEAAAGTVLLVNVLMLGGGASRPRSASAV